MTVVGLFLLGGLFLVFCFVLVVHPPFNPFTKISLVSKHHWWPFQSGLHLYCSSHRGESLEMLMLVAE